MPANYAISIQRWPTDERWVRVRLQKTWFDPIARAGMRRTVAETSLNVGRGTSETALLEDVLRELLAALLDQLA